MKYITITLVILMLLISTGCTPTPKTSYTGTISEITLGELMPRYTNVIIKFTDGNIVSGMTNDPKVLFWKSGETITVYIESLVLYNETYLTSYKR